MNLKNALPFDLNLVSVGTNSHFNSDYEYIKLLYTNKLSDLISVLRIVYSYHCGVCNTDTSYCFVFPIKGKSHMNGYLLDARETPLKMALIDPEKRTDFCFKEPQQSYYVTIDKAAFDHRFKTLLKQNLSEMGRKGFIYLKNLTAKKNLFRLLKQATKKSTPSDVEDRASADVILDCLIESINTHQEEESSLPYANHMAVKLHSYLLGKKTQALTLDEICKQNKVNRRTIQKGFKDLYGMGPLQFHRLYRLHQVRIYLRKNGSVNTSLIDIIGMYGFYHSGRFSQYYKRAFGILPSHERRSVK